STILSQLALALHHMDLKSCLIVSVSRECRASSGGDGCVARQDFVHPTPHRLHSKRKRQDVQEEHFIPLAAQRSGRDRRSVRHDEIRVQVGECWSPKHTLHILSNSGHPGGTTH